MATVKYIDELGQEQILTDNYTLITDSDSAVTWGELYTTSYYVVGADYNGDGEINADDAALGKNTFTITGGATAEGTVKLILADGFSLTSDASAMDNAAGICVQNSSVSETNYRELYIYGQTNGTGTLTAKGGTSASGIGSNMYQIGSNITIAGGTVNASSSSGAGIGGGLYAQAAYITITGGVVNAESSVEDGAAIGGGKQGAASYITIKGGTVNATATCGGAAIGSGAYNSASNITISGGVVNAATKAFGGAAIGGGYTGHASDITISGGTVTASSWSADAIGNGFGGSDSSNIIVNTEVYLKAGSDAASATNVEHTTETSVAENLVGKTYAAAVKLPTVSYVDENGETQTTCHYELVTDSDSAVTWDAGTYVVGADYDGNGVIDDADAKLGKNTFTINAKTTVNGTVKLIVADGFSLTVDTHTTDNFAAINVSNSSTTATDNQFFLYAQADGTGTLNVYSGTYGACIGGDCNQIGSNITITGGTVNASCVGRGAAIGGGIYQEGANITITGGVINADAGVEGGAAIGGGSYGGASNLTISGGTINAVATGSAIGGGTDGNVSGITISGGVIDATTIGYGSAAIGSGSSNYNEKGYVSNVTISGGTVNATAVRGAGIGACRNFNADNITISGGVITATSTEGDAIGSGVDGAVSTNVTVNTELMLLAGADAGSAAAVEHTTGTDIAASLHGKKYASAELLPSVSYVDENGETQTTSHYVLVTDSASSVTWSTGYYVVGADYDGNGVIDAEDAKVEGKQTSFTISDQALVNGTVKLILVDGFSLSVDTTATAESAAINVHNDSTTATLNQFFVYGQADGTGTLNVESAIWGAGIGGNIYQIGSNITLAGGTVNVNMAGGANRGRAAAIGGGFNCDGANITIAGGVVNANGNTEGGAAIGGGGGAGASNITISGGTVNASSTGAAIGGGNDGKVSGITISGGVVNAVTDSGSGAAIGTGANNYQTAEVSNITISGGVVNATAAGSGAAIGASSGQAASNITISGGTVIGSTLYGSAIGSGYGGAVSSGIYVSTESLVAGDSAASADDVEHGATVDSAADLAGKHYAAATPGLPKVSYVDESGETQTINKYTLITDSDSAVTWGALYTTSCYVVGADYNEDGFINAADAEYAAENELQTSFTITGGATAEGTVKLILVDGFSLTVDASATQDKAGICVQNSTLSATNYRELYVYGQSAGTGTLTSWGGTSASGIGSNPYQIGSNVTIVGGTVNARGGQYGAGIGGGYDAPAAYITIAGGVVNAESGKDAAAIGGGIYDTASYITISGGTVNAVSTSGGAAIGGGSYGSASDITISGGVVNATSGDGTNGSAIGAGYGSDASNITISGGTVNASANSGAGIGGGEVHWNGTGGVGSDITISGGKVTASSNKGSGIGSGINAETGSGIYVSTDVLVAGDSAITATDVAHGATVDSAADLAGKKYAATTLPPSVSYVDENGETQSTIQYTLITDSDSSVTWTTGIYVVGADYNDDGVINAEDAKVEGKQTSFTISNQALVNGTVKLILVDGFSLNVDTSATDYSAAINVHNDSTTATDNQFFVYGQAAGSGVLSVESSVWGAGIGGNHSQIGSNITIAGGTVNVNMAGGADRGRAAGIGGGFGCAGANISIVGGVVNVDACTEGGAAIGGGGSGSATNITISGGVVNAVSEGPGAVIGGGSNGSASNITISGGVISAIDNHYNGAGIGCGVNDSGTASVSGITITGGTIYTQTQNGAGIGGGNKANASDITISGGVISATATSGGAGIGGGNEGSADKITISGGEVNAITDSGAAIGSGAESSGQGGASNITISGGVVNASSNSGAGIGSGSDEGAEACSGVTISGGAVNASSHSGAGIGGGKEAAAKDITISGGVVNASANSGAGIGGGESKGGDNIQLKGGVVNANSVTGAGIGGGEADCAGTIEISGGIIYAVSTNADGIGAGDCGGTSGGVYVDVDYTVRGGTSAEEWDYVSEAGDHTEYDDLTDDLAGMHYASVCILSDGSEFTNSAYYDGVSTCVECFEGGEDRMLFGGGVLSESQEVTKSYALSVDSGSFENSVAAGYAANGSAVVEQTGDVALVIDGGTFDKRVAGGMYVATETSSATLTGDVTVAIKGGTFSGRIYGGCNSQQDSCGENGTIVGSVNLTIDSSANAIYIGNYLIGGSRGAGAVTGDVTVTFTGLGSNLSFNGGTSVVAGGCNSDYVKIDAEGVKTTVSAVDGSRNLVFDDFDGDFGADLRLFSTATFKNNSDVTLTDNRVNLWSIATWNFEAGSSLAGLQANDFENDTLNFNLTGWDETDWTAASGSVDAFDDLNLASAVYFGTSKASYDTENACWTDDTYKLALNSDKTAMIVSKIA